MYLPDPQMLLRTGENWVPVYELFAMDWIDCGCFSAAVNVAPSARLKRLHDVLALEGIEPADESDVEAERLLRLYIC